MIKILSFKSNYGWISCKEKDNKIVSIFFGKRNVTKTSKSLIRLKNEIIRYLSGNKKKISLSPLLSGSEIQIKIWKELQKIPYGKTRSYGQIAKKLNTSSRYVGNVCGQNKFLLVVPCHRVIRSDGKLGGFSGLGGIKLKERLINLELNNKNL